MYRNCLFAFGVMSIFLGSLRAQDDNPIVPVQLVDAAFQDEEPDGTLPPVEVRPPYDTTSNASPYTFPGGGIPWSSGEIYSDQQLVGPYNQPVWTTQRPWATTRVYVLPPGQAQVEQWIRPTYPRGGKPKFRMLEEFAIGLPGRFQLDLYERWNIEQNALDKQEVNHEGVQVELRWALANWGVIPLNPTLYIEWVERGGPQEKPNVYEAKLLMGDQIGDNWYYGTNFVLEQETSGEREQELAWSQAFSTTVIDRILLAGFETNLTSNTAQGTRGDPQVAFTIGPSVQLRPTNRTFLDVVALFGVSGHSPDMQAYIIFGYQFGTRAAPSGYAPASTIGN